MLHTTIIGSDDDIALTSSRDLELHWLELDLRVRLVCYHKGVEADMQQLFAD